MSKEKTIPKHSMNKLIHINDFKYAPYFLFPLRQGCRDESTLVVNIGQVVESGTLLAVGGGGNNQNIHSSIGGKVIRKKSMRFPGDLADINVLEIKFGGNFKFFSLREEIDMTQTKVKTILSRIAHAGIYDLDIGSLDHILFNKIQSGDVTHIVINAVEIGPYMLLEEMIMRKHLSEIIAAVKILISICNMSGKDFFPNVLCYSNLFNTRHKFVSQMKNTFNLNNTSVSTQSLSTKFSEDEMPASNYSWFMKKLSHGEASGKTKDRVNLDRMLVLRPSTLLALYELLFLQKPVIDKYIQIISGINASFIMRIPIGMPIFYTLSNCSGITKGMQHYFYGDILQRNAVVNFAIPISKQVSHYFMLTDDEFSKMYKKLKCWM